MIVKQNSVDDWVFKSRDAGQLQRSVIEVRHWQVSEHEELNEHSLVDPDISPPISLGVTPHIQNFIATINIHCHEVESLV